jgi:hypothetical protein
VTLTLMVIDDALNPGKLRSAICKKAVYTVQDLVKVLAPENMTTKTLRETAIATTGMSRSMFYELLKDLKGMAGVTFDEKKELWDYQNPNGANLK